MQCRQLVETIFDLPETVLTIVKCNLQHKNCWIFVGPPSRTQPTYNSEYWFNKIGSTFILQQRSCPSVPLTWVVQFTSIANKTPHTHIACTKCSNPSPVPFSNQIHELQNCYKTFVETDVSFLWCIQFQIEIMNKGLVLSMSPVQLSIQWPLFIWYRDSNGWNIITKILFKHWVGKTQSTNHHPTFKRLYQMQIMPWIKWCVSFSLPPLNGKINLTKGCNDTTKNELMFFLCTKLWTTTLVYAPQFRPIQTIQTIQTKNENCFPSDWNKIPSKPFNTQQTPWPKWTIGEHDRWIRLNPFWQFHIILCMFLHITIAWNGWKSGLRQQNCQKNCIFRALISKVLEECLPGFQIDVLTAHDFNLGVFDQRQNFRLLIAMFTSNTGFFATNFIIFAGRNNKNKDKKTNKHHKNKRTNERTNKQKTNEPTNKQTNQQTNEENKK